jgi:tRNA(Ile)-lysidine synthase
VLGVEARHDLSNEQLRYGRNRVRRRVLPELERVHRGAARSIARFAGLARRDDEALEALAAVELARIASRERGAVALERRELAALPEALASRVLRQAARDLGLEPNAGQLEALAGAARRRGARVDLDGGRGSTDGTTLRLERGAAPH